MQTERVSWVAPPREPVPDLRVQAVQPAGPSAYRGLVRTASGAQARFHVTIEPEHLVLVAFGERRVLPRLAGDEAWPSQEPGVVLGLALIVADP